ncbi:Acid shock protein [Kosakonia sp. BK9b]
MKKIALLSAVVAVSFSSMIFAADHPPVPPKDDHHRVEKKPLPPKHKPAKPPKHHEKKPPLPDDHR